MRGAVCLCWPIERRESLNILWDPFPLCCFLLRLLRCRNGQPQNGNLSTNATTTELCSKHPGRQTTLVQSSTRRSRLFSHPSVAHPRFGPPSSSSCRASKFRNANFLSPYKTKTLFPPPTATTVDRSRTCSRFRTFDFCGSGRTGEPCVTTSR